MLGQHKRRTRSNKSSKKRKRSRLAHEFQEWKLGTCNISTGRDDFRVDNAIAQVSKAKLLICGFQEVRRLGAESKLLSHGDDKYEFHWSGHARKREAGVGIAIKITPGLEIGEIKPISARLMTAELDIFGLSVKIAVCYAPTETGSENSKVLFYRCLLYTSPSPRD